MIQNNAHFTFREIDISEVENEIKNLNPKKTTTFGNIPIKVLKSAIDACAPTIHSIINYSFIRDFAFPNNLKRGDISPIFQKEDATDTKNYRPVSVLPAVSKIFERIMHTQLIGYIDRYLSPIMCGYRHGYSKQYALIKHF